MSLEKVLDKEKIAADVLAGTFDLGMQSGIAEDKLKLLYLMAAGHCHQEAYVLNTSRDHLRFVFRRVHAGLISIARLTKKEMAELLPAYLVFYDLVKVATRRKHPNVGASGEPVQHQSCRE